MNSGPYQPRPLHSPGCHQTLQRHPKQLCQHLQPQATRSCATHPGTLCRLTEGPAGKHRVSTIPAVPPGRSSKQQRMPPVQQMSARLSDVLTSDLRDCLTACRKEPLKCCAAAASTLIASPRFDVCCKKSVQGRDFTSSPWVTCLFMDPLLRILR